ncbi:MAG: SIS domain-containing protein, partial [Rubrivivax sp.]
QVGPETSLTATKSSLCQLAAGAAFLAAWEAGGPQGARTAPVTRDADPAEELGEPGSRPTPGLRQALQQLPSHLELAARVDTTAALSGLLKARQLYVIGRGTGWPVAMEMALKLKELCGVQAEAFSGAEVQHGPVALVEEGFTVLVLAPRGPAQAGLLELAAQLRARGANVLLAAPADTPVTPVTPDTSGTPGTLAAQLPIVPTGDPELDPLSALQSFYGLVEALARARGLDPDTPRHLSKVTRTR